ncbi:luciferase domain-containing protein [Aeromicrobium sp.]|uniref:luciferase domain-containing protein n=1 Tax=Aeromicrobium sp. TaxID=1871063 RepID=UPI002FC7FD87
MAQRAGSRPSTTAKIPHSQTNQQPADAHFLTQVLDEAASWPDVVQGASGISVEGARALSLADGVAGGLPEAFMVGREFCHGHAQGDYSLHMTLPLELVDAIDASGWIEPHFLVLTGQLPRTHVMVYAPRDGQEVAVVTGLVRASYEFARGLAQA